MISGSIYVCPKNVILMNQRLVRVNIQGCIQNAILKKILIVSHRNITHKDNKLLINIKRFTLEYLSLVNTE